MYDVYDSADAMLAKVRSQRGPAPGMGRSHGHAWRGIVEETPCLWVTWLTEGCRRAGLPVPEAIRIDGDVGDSVRVRIVGVELTYGVRHYFQAPCCGRRVEALYFLGREFGCRKCLRLGYRSQVYRPGSIWLYLDRVFDRRSLWRRWEWPENVVMRNIVEPARELLKARIEDMLSRVEVHNGDEATDD